MYFICRIECDLAEKAYEKLLEQFCLKIERSLFKRFDLRGNKWPCYKNWISVTFCLTERNPDFVTNQHMFSG